LGIFINPIPAVRSRFFLAEKAKKRATLPSGLDEICIEYLLNLRLKNFINTPVYFSLLLVLINFFFITTFFWKIKFLK
jgi:hypothetical protein